MNFLTPDTIESIRWSSNVVMFAMAKGAPIVPIGTVLGIMAWGEMFRGTTIPEALRRGWPWLLASLPLGYLFWLATKDWPVPQDLLSDSAQPLKWVTTDSITEFFPGTSESKAQSGSNDEARMPLARLNLLDIAAADVGPLCQGFLGHIPLQTQMIYVAPELDINFSISHRPIKPIRRTDESEQLLAFLLYRQFWGRYPFTSGASAEITKKCSNKHGHKEGFCHTNGKFASYMAYPEVLI